MNGAAVSGGQVICDGGDDYVELPAAAIAINTYSALTLELWSTQPLLNQSYSMTAAFGGRYLNGFGRDYLMLCTTRGDEVSRAAIANTDSSSAPWSYEVGVNGPELNDGQEHYYAMTIEGTTLSYYIDGVLQGTADLGSTKLSQILTTYAYLARSLYNADPYVQCSINEFRIWDSALSAGQIAQHAAWGPNALTEPLVQIAESDGRTILFTSEPSMTDTFSVELLEAPSSDVYVNILPPAGLTVGNGGGQLKILTFTSSNWNQPQTVTVGIADVGLLGSTERIEITTASADPEYQGGFYEVQVSVYEDRCGVWGYVEADYNLDCVVDLEDFAILGRVWLSTEVPLDLEQLAADWLRDTLVYEEQVYERSIQISQQPFTVNPSTVLNTIDEKVYGHFLEHIYHSANGGLWGELVWNRSFELDAASGGGLWSIEGDELVQSSLATDVHMEFGDPSWGDYELTLEAKKDGGNEAFLILFRASDTNNFYWCNIGGWNNTQHAIEKEVNGGRGVVTSYVPGSIDTGVWYSIRIRCQGNRFQVWLNDMQLFDYTDSSSPHLTGMVGLGTWATQARYRNIQVVSLTDSSVLFSGLPTLPPAQFAARNWTFFGSGSASTVRDALNDDVSVRIDAASAGAGLQQDNFKLIPQMYSGSLWMKGTLSAGVRVQLLDGSTVLGQADLPAPTSEWAEYPFQISSAGSTNSGSLRILLLGAGTVYIDQVSMMGADAMAVGGYRPDLLAAVEDLRPPVIRWPGGCFASLYLWKDGIGPQHQRRRYAAYMWDDQDTNSFGTDEFLRMCERIGAEPLICINTGVLNSACGAPAQWKLVPDTPETYLQYALDWMEYCNGDAQTTYWGSVRAANGHPEPYNVVYWEIDNETWAAGSAAYIARVQLFAPAMRAKAAELGVPIYLIAVGSGGYDQSWNQDILNGCASLIDYISVHYYEDPSGFKSGPVNYENYLINLAGRIAASANPDIKIYNSEWNAQSTDWRTGLFAGGILNAYERQGANFKIGGPALFLRHTSASGWDNAFINFDHTGWFAAPNYVVMKLWRDHYAPYRVQTSGDDNNLNVVSVLSEDGQTLTIRVVNPDAQDKSLAFEIDSSFVPETAVMHYVAPGSLYARNTLAQPNAVHVEAKVVGLNGQALRLRMPAYSAGVISVQKQ
jgi:alpha-N-arabinofuranosidase